MSRKKPTKAPEPVRRPPFVEPEPVIHVPEPEPEMTEVWPEAEAAMAASEPAPGPAPDVLVNVMETDQPYFRPEEELAFLQDRIAKDQKRVWELEHPIIEFPKMVNGRTFANRAEQDAAGADYADKEPKA